jgi:ABC-type Fe3+-hydroxamate transport system substrate-binding protein
MSDDTTRGDAPTRREYVKYGGTVIGGALLAGCTGDSDSGSTSTPTDTDTETPTPTDTDTPTPQDDSYTVRLAPVGDVEFDTVPENAFTVFPWYADMAFALGHGDSINSLWWSEGFNAIMQYFTADLDGVSVSWDGLTGEYGASKEQLYELDSDVDFVDPAWVSTLDNWNQDDIDEIVQNVGPWFGNQYSNLHLTPPDAWADRYEYYTLWELFEKVAQVYREQARYAALADVHAEVLTTIEERLPPEDERPTVGYVQVTTDLDAIYVLRLNAPGYYNSHTRPLRAIDAFSDEDIEGEFKQVDFEAVLEADPDVLLTLWGMTSNVDFEKMRSNLEDHSVGRELSAVQNDRVYTQGTRFQGPVMNLFQLEMTAKQLYPDEFGAWPGYVEGETYPDFSEDEQLFDRQRVANIINGDI